MNKVQLNNTSIDLAVEMLASLKRGDIGSIQLAIVMVITELEPSDLHGEYEQLCSAALPHANQWNLNKTLSAVSFYIHELVSLVSNGELDYSKLNKILLELSIALKFNAFHVSKQCRKYNLSREQTIKLLTVNSYE